MFKGLNHLSIAKKIGGGFAVVLALLVLVGGAGLYGIYSSAEGFSEYRRLARNTNLIGRIQANMLEVRLQAMIYAQKSTDESIDEFNNRFKLSMSLLEDAKTRIKNKERLKKIVDIDENLLSYKKAFGSFVVNVKKRDKAIDILNENGPKIEKNLTEILTAAYQNQNAESAYHAAELIRSLLLARLYVMKYLESNSKSDINKVTLELNNFDKKAQELSQSLKDPNLATLLQKALEFKAIYLANTIKIEDAIFLRNKVKLDVMDKVGPRVTASIEDIKLSYKKDQDQLGPQIADLNKKLTMIKSSLMIVALVLGVFISIKIVSKFKAAINSIVEAVGYLSKGDFTQIIKSDSNDELGQISNQLNHMTDSLSKMLREITENSVTLSASAEELSVISQSMANHASTASHQSAESAEIISQITEKLHQMSSASEEMYASINQISHNTSESSQIAREATQLAEQSQVIVRTLNQSSEEIGEIIKSITVIAEQTNLLALNATIEAARAGEAGTGFAVVANEVKELANATNREAEQIKQKVLGIQKGTRSTSESIQSISTVIGRINEIASTIASAVEEQSATTESMSENVTAAASESEEISHNVKAVSEVAERTSHSSSELMNASLDLSEMASNLKSTVARFKIT
ncbi:methyl-accepting chemotaxis protein [Myxococcota bacterium]|nr:methyl-accepting chemotaxis protein [Myxococcota bacterium]MBU1430348.1 methyl-accepting chemotaxis protein [Myxococcota bacterium]MBU1896884.1 methyl-accepting chemotaxis protein [Myxococcota bacterium]